MQGVLEIVAIREEEGDFLGLTSAFSALYAKDSEEKRLLGAMLLAMPR